MSKAFSCTDQNPQNQCIVLNNPNYLRQNIKQHTILTVHPKLFILISVQERQLRICSENI